MLCPHIHVWAQYLKKFGEIGQQHLEDVLIQFLTNSNPNPYPSPNPNHLPYPNLNHNPNPNSHLLPNPCTFPNP